MSDGARIGHLNIFKGMRNVSIGVMSSIGRYNIFTSSRYYQGLYPTEAGVLVIGNKAAVTMRHYFDLQHRISIGDHSLVAGIGTVLFTHQKGAQQLDEAKAITIGSRVYVGAACVVVPGTTIADNVIVGAGSVVGGNLDEPYVLYSSPRAMVVRELDKNHSYLRHDNPAGPIAPRAQEEDPNLRP